MRMHSEVQAAIVHTAPRQSAQPSLQVQDRSGSPTTLGFLLVAACRDTLRLALPVSNAFLQCSKFVLCRQVSLSFCVLSRFFVEGCGELPLATTHFQKKNEGKSALKQNNKMQNGVATTSPGRAAVDGDGDGGRVDFSRQFFKDSHSFSASDWCIRRWSNFRCGFLQKCAT